MFIVDKLLIESLKERLARLEAKHLDGGKEPSKPIDKHCVRVCLRCNHSWAYEEGYDKCPACGNAVYGYSVKPVTEEKTTGLCSAHRYGEDKPSEFISIPRGVAERYIKSSGSLGAYSARKAMYEAIKQALKGQE